MLKKFCIPCLCVLGLATLSTPEATAQATTTGNVAGTVTDSQGAVIPHASLTIVNPATGSRNMQTGNSLGAYTFSDLQVGTYQLTSTAPGFATTLVKDVSIETGRSINVNISMAVGAASQEVTVSADTQVLETTSNTLAATIKPDAVQDLPLSGRDVSGLTQLAPGSQAVGTNRYATFNNLPQGAINITVDGMNSNFQRFRTNTSGNYSPAPVRLGAIEEISVSTAGLTADAGAEGAVAERFQIKRGTNKLHGSGFWQHQNSALNANSYANDARGTPITKFHLNDEGGNIGGPILKNKLFFFANYEQEFVPGTSLGTQYVLTQAAQSGNFTYTGTDNTTHTVNVLTVAQNNGYSSAINARIASELSQANTYLSQAGVTHSGALLPIQETDTWAYHTESKNVYPTVRIDYQITPSFDFHAAYDLWWRTLPGTQIYDGDPYTTGAFKSSYQTITAGADWSITQHLVNQIQFGLLNDQERYNPTNSFTPYDSVNNIIFANTSFTNGNGSLAPITSTGGLTEPRNNPVTDVFDNLTWNKGRHTFTFGGDYRASTSHDLSISNPPAATMGVSTSYDPINSIFNATNFPFLNVAATNQQDVNNAKLLYATLTGRLTQISGQNAVDSASGQYKVLGDLVLKEAQTVGGFYMQDAWRPTPHFTLNYGFRWQFSGTVHNTSNVYTSPTLADLRGPSTAPFRPGTLNGITNPQIYLRPTNYGADLKQPAPNLGFAYNPAWNDGKLVIRAGAAISHYDEGWITWETASSNNPGLRQTASLTAGPTTTTAASQFPAGTLFLGATPSLYTTPASFSFPLSQSAFTYASGGNLYTVDPNIRSPYIENWYLGFQYKLPWNFVIETNYVANHSIHMWDAFNINETNIFENGFLAEFQRAQANLAASGNKTFAGTNLPIMNQAFGGTTAFTNSTYISYLQNGQAGALANVMSATSQYFCNLVGNGGGNFSPCNRVYGKTAGTNYATNFFVQNPFSTGTSSTTATELSDPSSSNYQGLQTQLKHPAGKNLTLMMNYAYSHSFSDRYIGTSDSATNNFITLRNPYLNHGPSPSDIRNAFKAYAVYKLPFHSHNSLLREVVDDWTLSPLFTWQTGRNFKLLGGTNTVNTSDSGVVLTGVDNFQLQKSVGRFRNPVGSTTQTTPILLMDPAVFTKPAGGVATVSSPTAPGSFGQFVFLKSPQLVDTDFAVTKEFPIFERLKFSIQAEMVNIFNHPNFAAGSTDAPAQTLSIQSVSATGVPSLPASITGGARTIQFRTQIAF